MPRAAPYPIKYASVAEAMNVGHQAEEQRYRRQMRELQKEAGPALAEGDYAGAAGALARGGNLEGATALQTLGMNRQKAEFEQNLAKGKRLAGGLQAILSMEDPEQQNRAYQTLRTQAALAMDVDVSSMPTSWSPEAAARSKALVGMYQDLEGQLNRQTAVQRTGMTAEAAAARQAASDAAAMERTQAQVAGRRDVAAENNAARMRLKELDNQYKKEKRAHENVRLPSGETTAGFTENGKLWIYDQMGEKQEAPYGSVTVKGTATATELGQDKVARREWEATVANAISMTNMGNSLVHQIESGKVQLGTAAGLTNFIDSTRAQAEQLIAAFGDEKDDRRFHEYADTKNWADVFEKQHIQNATLQSALVLMAYNLAKISDRAGRVSDKDFEAHLKALAASQGNPKVLAAVVKERINHMHGVLRARADFNPGFNLPEWEWDYGESAPSGGNQQMQGYVGPDGRSWTAEQIRAAAEKRGLTEAQAAEQLGLKPRGQ